MKHVLHCDSIDFLTKISASNFVLSLAYWISVPIFTGFEIISPVKTY